MFTDVVHRDLPTSISMAEVTLRSIFAAVNIRVAVLALFADVGEDEIGVAIPARHLGVHSAQCKPRLAMFEFRDRANRGPPLWGVTILAGNV